MARCLSTLTPIPLPQYRCRVCHRVIVARQPVASAIHHPGGRVREVLTGSKPVPPPSPDSIAAKISGSGWYALRRIDLAGVSRAGRLPDSITLIYERLI